MAEFFILTTFEPSPGIGGLAKGRVVGDKWEITVLRPFGEEVILQPIGKKSDWKSISKTEIVELIIERTYNDSYHYANGVRYVHLQFGFTAFKTKQYIPQLLKWLEL